MFKLLLFVSIIKVSILYSFFYPWMKKWEPAEKGNLKHNWKIKFISFSMRDYSLYYGKMKYIKWRKCAILYQPFNEIAKIIQ